MKVNSELEVYCDIIDGVLQAYKLPGRVAGGYVTRKGLLFSLHDTTFPPQTVVEVLQEIFNVQITVTVGVILLQDRPKMIRLPQVETVDIFELMG